MLIPLTMVWRHLTTKLGRPKGWSGLTQYGQIEVTRGSQEEEEVVVAEEEATVGES